MWPTEPHKVVIYNHRTSWKILWLLPETGCWITAALKNKHCRLYQRRLFARLLASDTHVYRTVAMTTGNSEGGQWKTRTARSQKSPGGSRIPSRATHPQILKHGGNLTGAAEERVSSATGARRRRHARAANAASLIRQFKPRVSEFTGWFVQLFDTMLADVLRSRHERGGFVVCC